MFKKNNIPWNKDKKGIHLSPKSEFKKGNIPWLKNKKNPYSTSTIKAMSEAKKGKRLSIGTEFKKSHIPWNKGLTKYTDERCKQAGIKIRKALKGRKRPNMSKALMGRKLTKEHIKNCLRRRTPTSLEEKFQKIINKNNLPYKYVGNGKFFIENFNPDFINTNHEKIAIEVYAKYYKLRNSKTIEEWKKERNRVFKKYGWKVIYFDEIEVKEQNVLNKIRKEVF